MSRQSHNVPTAPFVLRCVTLLLVLLFTGCSSDHHKDPQETQRWGVYRTMEDNTVDTNDTAWQFSSCNAGYRSVATSVSLSLWELHIQSRHVEARDTVKNEVVANGQLEGDQLSLTTTDEGMTLQGTFRRDQRCFDLSSATGYHWHGIRLPDDDAPETIDSATTDYATWRDDWLKELSTQSQVIETAVGPIQYALSAGSGPVLAFNHGGPGSFYSTPAYFSDLYNQGFRILCWSRPGNLGTPLHTGLSVEDQADALAALLDSLSIDQIAVIGASAGGPPSYQFAIRHPQRTWALVAVDAISQAYGTDEGASESLEVWMALLSLKGGMWLYNALYEYAPLAAAHHFIGMISTMDDEANLELARSVIADDSKGEMLGRIFLSMAPSEDLVNGTFTDLGNYSEMPPMALDKISAPTLIVHGTADGDVPTEDALHAADEIIDSELYWVDEGTHVFSLSPNSQSTLNHILEFLREHAPMTEGGE
ncbi:alpha/beta hydrolase [Desulfuromonas thiophila]|uniref:alpha/beta fold hydrolase n=1 Tax=Desulfuromonas thiophila TaxID=57664 RepID=UPI0029F57746|nr:alpha/beta hydrolase [Desulfuromonas thiophila]